MKERALAMSRRSFSKYTFPVPQAVCPASEISSNPVPEVTLKCQPILGKVREVNSAFGKLAKKSLFCLKST